EAIDLCVADGMLAAWPYHVAFLALALLEQGQAEEAARVIEQGDFPEQLPVDQVSLVWFRLCRGRLRIETGSPGRGVDELLQVGESVRLVPSTIQPASRGADGPPKAFDSSTGTSKRVRAWPKNSRSLNVGVTRTPSVPVCACSVPLRAARRESGCSGRRLRGSQARRQGSSTPAQWWTSAPRSAAPTAGPRHASCSGRASTSRERSARSGSPSERTAGSPPRERGRDKRCEAAKGPPDGARRAHRERAARGTARSRRDEQQGGRADALRHDQDCRGASEQRLSQARDQLPRAARQCPADSHLETGVC